MTAVLDRQSLRSLAGPRSFERGEEYFAAGSATLLSGDDEHLNARVRGTRTYHVQLWAEEGELDFSCTCPVGEDGELCKHCVAAGLAWLAEKEGAPGEPAGVDLRALRSFLSRQEKDRLVDLLVERAAVDEGLLQVLSLEMAHQDGKQPDLAALRRIIASAFDPGDFLSYNEVDDFSQGCHAVADTLADLLKKGRHQEVIELAELALDQGEGALGQVDDSGGAMMGVLERLQELHLAACKKGRPDPEALARRLFAWETRSEWGIFHRAVRTYAGVLGKTGLAVYRGLAEAEWKKLPSVAPGASERYDGKRFYLTGIMEELARLSGDLEALVAVKSRDLSIAYRFLEIAQLYKAAGRADRALEWAEKGLRAFPQHTDHRLREFLAGEYHARGRSPEAMSLVWACFEEQRTLENYSLLKSHAERIQRWPEWRDKVLALLRDQAREEPRRSRPSSRSMIWTVASDLLVAIHLRERDDDAAWQVAQEHGCSEQFWLDLAKARERRHPEQAIPIYQRRIGSALQQTNEMGYREAVERLRHVRALMKRAARPQDFPPYLDSVRLEHKRKRNFQRLLEAAKLG